MFTPSTPFLKYEYSTYYTMLAGCADYCLLQIQEYETCRQQWSALFHTSMSAFQNRRLVGVGDLWYKLWQKPPAYCNTARKRHGRDETFQNLGYGRFVSRIARSMTKSWREKKCWLSQPAAGYCRQTERMVYYVLMEKRKGGFFFDISLITCAKREFSLLAAASGENGRSTG